jgi:hypothetical protein
MRSLEYIAGFFDGEGSIGVYANSNGTFFLRTQLTQNVSPESEKLLSELRDRWGGNLSRHTTTHGEAFNWQLNSKKAGEFLRDALPHLVLKAAQAEVALLWLERRPVPTRSSKGEFTSLSASIDADVAEFVKRLKKIGVSEEALVVFQIRVAAGGIE